SGKAAVLSHTAPGKGEERHHRYPAVLSHTHTHTHTHTGTDTHTHTHTHSHIIPMPSITRLPWLSSLLSYNMGAFLKQGRTGNKKEKQTNKQTNNPRDQIKKKQQRRI